MTAQITIYHDTRRRKDNNLYPIKLRIWDSITKKAKLYPLNIDLSEKEFAQSWETQKPRKEFQETKIILDSLLAKANKILKQINYFNFDEFERKLFRKAGDGINIIWQYERIIETKFKNGEIGTSQSYKGSLKSIIEFLQYKGAKSTINLTFFDITKDWLKEYEVYMTKERGRTLTTVGIYLRPLRAIFNIAIEEKEILQDVYPFGKRKYQIPTPKGKKKALTGEQLKALLESKALTTEQQKAKDFWFFSYACNGMNIKDIGLLRYKDINNDTITFYRAKTINTSKANLKPITVYLTDFPKAIIEKYGNKDKQPNSFIFDIISDSQNPLEQKYKTNQFTGFINQHIKKLCISIDLPNEISTYWARHSFATNSIRKGASIEFMQESLGHSNPNTTIGYFAGFDSKAKKEFAEKLMDFE